VSVELQLEDDREVLARCEAEAWRFESIPATTSCLLHVYTREQSCGTVGLRS
jgi:hypothetical protein